MANQFRNYILTVNNPKETDEEFFNYLKSLEHLKYCIFQREKGEETGTEHFQVYIEFTIGKKFDVMKKNFPTAHIEMRQGSKTQARDYCSKADTRISTTVYEFGEFAEEKERTDLNDIIQLIENGASDMEIKDAFPSQYFRYSKHIQQYRQTYLEDKYKKVFRTLEVNYIFGSAGIGKTRYVMEKYGFENVYRVTDYILDPFYSYKNEDVIVFEEFRSSIKIEEVLNYLDGYPLMLASRYHNKVACYTKVYIVTNLPLYKQYENLKTVHPDSWNAFLRRITNVYDFNKSKKEPINKGFASQKPLSEKEAEQVKFIFGVRNK